MSVPRIFRSTDTNAPPLSGIAGCLRDLLDAVLVTGYGTTFATGTLTSNTVSPSNGDTVTVGSVTYTFRTSLTGAANEVFAPGSASGALSNLAAAINLTATSGTSYTAATVTNPDVWASAVTSTVLTLTARVGGTGGNSLSFAKSATNLTVSGATLSGGGGSNTTTALGWTKPFSSNAGGAYKPAAGNQMYIQIEDNGSALTGLGREAAAIGYETMSAMYTGTGAFPSATVRDVSATINGVASTGYVPIRKSTTNDNTARSWILVGDDRTMYLFVLSGDSASVYLLTLSFGDFYSYVSGDAYRTMLIGHNATTTSALASHKGGIAASTNITSIGGHFVPRNYAGAGGATAFMKAGDIGLSGISSGSAQDIVGTVGFPNPADGGLYVAPLRVLDAATPGATLSGTIDLRGKLRGLWHAPHAVTVFADGDTFAGAGEYAGRTFMIVKPVMGATGNGAFFAVETTAWDTSS